MGEEGGSRREASCKVEQDRCKGSREEGRNSRRAEWSKMRWTEKEESQGRGSLVGCCLWGHTESDTTEVT